MDQKVLEVSSLSLSFSDYLPTYLSSMYLSIYLPTYLPTYLSIYLYEFDRGSFDVDVGELKLEKKVTKR